MHARLFIAGLAIFLIVITVSGCGRNPVIGVLLPTSGDASSYGDSMKKAIDMALAEAQAEGAMPADLTIVWGDTASDAETGRAEVKRLADQGAKLIITGATSGTSRAFLPELEGQRRDRAESLGLGPRSHQGLEEVFQALRL